MPDLAHTRTPRSTTGIQSILFVLGPRWSCILTGHCIPHEGHQWNLRFRMHYWMLDVDMDGTHQVGKHGVACLGEAYCMHNGLLCFKFCHHPWLDLYIFHSSLALDYNHPRESTEQGYKRLVVTCKTSDPINTNQSTVILLFVKIKHLASMQYFVVVAI